MSSRSQSSALSWIALVTVWFFWGSTYLGIRVAVQTFPPLLMAGTRYIIAGAALGAILFVLQRKKRPKVTWRDLGAAAITGFLLLLVGNGLLCVSEVHLQSGTAALLVATTPIWMIAIDAALSRSISIASMAGMVLGTLGVLALVGGPSAHTALPSAALVLLGAAAWAVGSVYAKRSAHGTNPLLPALEMFAGGIMLTIAGAATGELSHVQFAHVPPQAVAGWVWLIVAGAMIAYTAYAYAVRTLPTNVVATYAYVNPIVAVILGVLLLKEPLSWNILAGGAAIVLSVVTILVGNRASAPALRRREHPLVAEAVDERGEAAAPERSLQRHRNFSALR